MRGRRRIARRRAGALAAAAVVPGLLGYPVHCRAAVSSRGALVAILATVFGCIVFACVIVVDKATLRPGWVEWFNDLRNVGLRLRAIQLNVAAALAVGLAVLTLCQVTVLAWILRRRRPMARGKVLPCVLLTSHVFLALAGVGALLLWLNSNLTGAFPSAIRFEPEVSWPLRYGGAIVGAVQLAWIMIAVVACRSFKAGAGQLASCVASCIAYSIVMTATIELSVENLMAHAGDG
jgi:hypothetical protein